MPRPPELARGLTISGTEMPCVDCFTSSAPDGNSVMHAELKIGDSIVMLGSEHPPQCLSPKSRGGTSVSLYLYFENADAAFDRAVKAGCTVKMPMTDQFWGDRFGQVEDPFGHQWSFATHKQDLSHEQIAANAKVFFEKMAKQAPEMATA